MITIELVQHATTVTAEDGTFHPAVTRGGISPVYYWKAVKCVTEQEAYDYACLALFEVSQAAQEAASGWSMAKL